MEQLDCEFSQDHMIGKRMTGIPDRPAWTNSNVPLPQNRASAISPLVTATNVDLFAIRPTAINTGSAGSLGNWLKLSGQESKVPPLQFVTVNFWRAVSQKSYPGETQYKNSTWSSQEIVSSDLQRFKASCSEIFDDGTASQSYGNTEAYSVTEKTGTSSSSTITVPAGQNHYVIGWQWTTAYAYLPQSVSAQDASAQPFMFDLSYFWYEHKNYGYAIGFNDWVYVGGPNALGAGYDFYDNGKPAP